jgi:hypothetical protein
VVISLAQALIGLFLGVAPVPILAAPATPTSPSALFATTTVGAAPTTSTPTPTATDVTVRNSFIAGVVFEDDDGDETRSGREDGRRDVTVTLQLNNRTGDKQRAKTDRNGAYEFRDLAAGTYLVTTEAPDPYVFTTNDRLEVKVDGQDGTRLADFGLIKKGAIATPTPVRRRSSSQASSSSRSSGGGSNPGSGGSQAVQSAPAAPPAQAPAATSTPTAAQQFGASTPLRSGQFLLEGRSDDNGLIAEFAARGSVMQPGDLDMRLITNGRERAILIADQKPYWRPIADDLWQPTNLAELRAQHGLLTAIDVLGLPQMAMTARSVRRAPNQELDDEGRVVRLYEIEPGPPVGPSAAKPGAAATAPGHFDPLDALFQVWVSADDGRMLTAHLEASFRSSRPEIIGRAEPARVDVWLRLSEHNAPFSIQAPLRIAVPTPAPAVAPSAGAVAAAPPAPASNPAPAAPSRAQAPSVPATDLRSGPPSAVEADQAAVAERPAAPEASADRRSRDAEEALVALASAAGPRDGSETGPDRVILAVPWVTEPMGSSAEAPINDGVASLRLILGSFGVTTQMEDLEALADGWQPPGAPRRPVPLETLIRIGERGSLRALGPTRGPGGGEWTATLARDFVQRGHPVLMRVRPGLLAGQPSAEQQDDRYVVLVGHEGEELLYHDPTAPDGARLRISADRLDQAWAGAALPRQGAAFGFGVNVIGLLQAATARAAATATTVPTATARAAPTSAPTVAVVATTPIPPLEVRSLEAPAQPSEQSHGWSLHPALLALFAVLACGVGFVVARLAR